ncbi:MAG TPA: peroxide stress protein YaaA [Pseudoduganella sp.]
MLIVLSPAKSLDLETPPTTKLATQPEFLDHSEQLIERLRDFSPNELGELMDLSDALSTLNVARYASWTKDTSEARQAVMTFNGDVYDGLDARSMSAKQLDYTQSRIRILSGLYGMLKPLDLIHPHRLEMGTRLQNPRGKNLYEFWGDMITEALNKEGSPVLVNLASDEYFKSVKPKKLNMPVITPVFEDWKGGKYKIISFFAKRARGMLARYAAVNNITDPVKLKKFDVDGYKFDADASNDTTWVFRRKIAA